MASPSQILISPSSSFLQAARPNYRAIEPPFEDCRVPGNLASEGSPSRSARRPHDRLRPLPFSLPSSVIRCTEVKLCGGGAWAERNPAEGLLAIYKPIRQITPSGRNTAALLQRSGVVGRDRRIPPICVRDFQGGVRRPRPTPLRTPASIPRARPSASAPAARAGG
jgi:hypothetical protein